MKFRFTFCDIYFRGRIFKTRSTLIPSEGLGRSTWQISVGPSLSFSLLKEYFAKHLLPVGKLQNSYQKEQ
jgi:hypothetical protein